MPRRTLPVRLLGLLGILFLGIVAFGAAPAFASGVVGNGTSASCTEAAFNAVISGGGSIKFKCGSGPVTITLHSAHTLSADTTIDGGNKVTLSASNVAIFIVPAGRSLTVKKISLLNGRAANGGAIQNNGTTALTKVHFLGNRATGNGGAIYNHGTLTVSDSTFTSNLANQGGAIANYAGTATLSAVTFNQNGGQDGGALYVATGTTVNISNSTFSQNQGTYGAGAENCGTLSVTASVFDANVATNDGGGIWNLCGTVVLEDTTLSRNTAGTTGGGLSNYGNTAVLRRVTLEHNTSSQQGGGIYNEDTVALQNVTIGENRGEGDGGAIYQALGSTTMLYATIANNTGTTTGGLYVAGGTMLLKNTLLDENVGSDCNGNVGSAGHNLSSDVSCTKFTQSGDKTDINQSISSIGRYGGYTDTYLFFSTGGPAVDAGIDAGFPTTDQRGVPRLEGSAPDIGAIEMCKVPTGKPVLLQPANGATITKKTVILDWNDPVCTLLYDVEIHQDSKKGPLAVNTTLLTASTFSFKTPAHGHTYFWRVSPLNDSGLPPVKSKWFTFRVP